MDNSNRIKLLKSINVIERLLEHLKSNGELCPLPYRDSFSYIFFANNELDKFFVNLFPNDKLDKFGRTLLIISRASGATGKTELSSSMGTIKREALESNLNEMRDVLSSSSASYNLYNIFYSWESDLPTSENRNFIESAIAKAIKKLKEEFGISIRLDKDTREMAGSPDIIRAILEKVDNCFMFIADVSIITRRFDKAFPNSNVMFELGYAIKAVGDESIIMLFNDATGSTNDLPFDLGLKRQMKFSCPDGISPEDKKAEKERLSTDIYNAIKLRLKLNEISV